MMLSSISGTRLLPTISQPLQHASANLNSRPFFEWRSQVVRWNWRQPTPPWNSTFHKRDIRTAPNTRVLWLGDFPNEHDHTFKVFKYVGEKCWWTKYKLKQVDPTLMDQSLMWNEPNFPNRLAGICPRKSIVYIIHPESSGCVFCCLHAGDFLIPWSMAVV